MNTVAVWVLVALVSNGHGTMTAVPTMEFKTKELCEKAIYSFWEDARHVRDGSTRAISRMRCVRIEK